MEFDISKVYTVINADDLPTGSEIYVADDLTTLKGLVERGGPSDILQNVRDREYIFRFIPEDNTNAYAFAYLITSPSNTPLKWQDLNIGDVIRAKDTGRKYEIIAEDERASVRSHVGTARGWLTNSELSNYEKVSLC